MTTSDLLPCPNPDCQSAEVYVGQRCNYVVCRKCHMTGPTSSNDEEAVRKWNRLPRVGADGLPNIRLNPICDQCGGEIIPGLVHYCSTIFMGQL